MNLFALAIHLLFFPFGNDGYTYQSWDWVIWFGDCQKQCDTREEGFTCGNNRKDFMHCYCWDCGRYCQLSEARVNIDYCNAAASHVAQVEVDVGKHLMSLTADLAIYYTKFITSVKFGKIGEKLLYPGLKFVKGVFEMDKDEELVNKVIADVNARLDTMNKCMGQRVEMAQVEDQIDSMQRAFFLYDQARSHQGDANDAQMLKLRSAWEQHAMVVHSEFDNVDRSAEFFGTLLLPMQDFAQSFILVSFDYLVYVHELDEANYEGAYAETIDLFRQLRTWADRARESIKSSISNEMHKLPCKNWQAIENEKNNWNAKFLSTHVYPIDSYMDRLAELNNVLVGADILIGNVVLQYGVEYAIKSVSSGYYLDGSDQSGNNPVLTNRNPEGDKHLHWIIVPTNVENQFALKSVSSGFYLDGRNEYLNNPLITNRDTADDYYLQWTFEKTNGTMEELDKSITTEYIGCYQDTAYRALRHGPPTFGYTPDTCSTACKDYKYFAVQAGGWCFCDDDYDHATRYGEAGGCPASKMGAEWRNDLFLNEMPNNVAIKSVSSQKYLDGRNGEIDPLLTNGNPMDDKHLQWQFIAQ